MPGALAGLRVIDASTVLAGPLACQILGDFGAEVIKVEHPSKPDALRTHGREKDGHGLWWKIVARNKRTVALDLAQAEGAELFVDLVRGADVLVENFRPGTLERWNLGPDVLAAANPRLVLVRVTGFGQTGPYARRPAFGTLIESMSGFAHITGQPDGPPTLPPFGLADSIAGVSAALSAVLALYHRDVHEAGGQAVDLSILEPRVHALGPQSIVYDQTGEVQQRRGNRSGNNAPRNTYRTRDGRWVAISASATSVAERVLRLVGRPDLAAQPWFASGSGRAEHADEIDGAVAPWIAARDRDEVARAFGQADAAVAPVYDVAELMADPQAVHRGVFTEVDPDLGPVRMQDQLFGMSETPGAVRFSGRAHGADTDEVLGELGVSAERLADLRRRGVVA
jgi:crotonobetainyl-CoA:carnitine CoA-transferase CaiB-like acyl-CoA transferase